MRSAGAAEVAQPLECVPSHIEFVSLILSLLGLGVAIWALRLARATTGVTERIDTAARNLSNTITELHKDLGDLDARQDVKLLGLGSAIEDVQELVEKLPPPLGDDLDDGEGSGPTPSIYDLSDYERMRVISLESLDQDVRDVVAEQSEQEPTWALRRRGRGRPRWLVGVGDGRSWSVTRARDGTRAKLMPRLPYKVEPLPLCELDAQGLEALVDATGKARDELGPTIVRRVSRGVPVFHAFAPTGPNGGSQVWRVVKTRWGWSAVPEEG
jgi:hypothetical protein